MKTLPDIYLPFQANVLPSDATAYVNHRIHPSQTVKEVGGNQLIKDRRFQCQFLFPRLWQIYYWEIIFVENCY